MKKRSVAFTIFRFLGFFIFIWLLAQFYWSFTLLESDVKQIIENQESIKKELRSIQKFSSTSEDSKLSSFDGSHRPHIDPKLPNLLEEDSFRSLALPKLLGPHFQPKGIFRYAQVGRPNTLHPFSAWGFVVDWISLCSLTVARQQTGKYETLSPFMALKMERRIHPQTGEVEFWIHLRDNVFWQPLEKHLFENRLSLASQFMERHPVTAEDFKFWWDALMNPYVQEAGAIALRVYYSDISSITVLDPLTLIVRWKGIPVEGSKELKTRYAAEMLTAGLQPLSSFVYKYFADGTKIIEEDSDPNTYQKNSVWAQNFNQHWAKNIIVSCGPWIFDGMTERQIRFKRNPDHFSSLDALTEAIEVQFNDSSEAMWEDFKSGKIDIYELRPDELLELESFLKSPQYLIQKQKDSSIERLDYVARMYAYIGWNAIRPFFSTSKMRRALTMAIDRKRIIRQNLNGMGIELTGPFYPYSSSTDPSILPWPYDSDQARQIFEQEGWYDHDNDGLIDKVINGKSTPFSFSLTYFVKGTVVKTICEYVSTVLREQGIDCHLNGADVADLSAAYDDKSFDAIVMAWGLSTPPENPRQLWHSSGAKQKGSSNGVGFSNEEADAIIDALEYESDPEKRILLYHRFCQIIHEEAPYTFLYTPKVALLYRSYVKNVFLPFERQDLIPGANVSEPIRSLFWLSKER